MSTTIPPSTTEYDTVVDMHPSGLFILGVVALYGTIGNIFIIGAVSLQPKIRVRGNAFVVNLAVADLIVCAYLMPLGLVSSQYTQEPFGKGLCDFNAFLLMTSCGVSTQTRMMIGIERYCHVCRISFYRRFFTPTLIAVYITVIWIYTSLWTCQGLTGWSRFVYGNDVWVCVVDASYSLSYNICLSLFGMVLPMVVLSFCYFMIFRMVYKTRKRLKHHRDRIAKKNPNSKKSKNEQKKEKKEFRLIVMLFTIVIVFCIFWIPAAIVIVFSAPWKSMPDILYTISFWMALTNSSLNSIIYGAMNQNFRIGYLMFFNKLFCWCADENNQVTCKSCTLFRKSGQDDSTSVSHTGASTSNANITDGSVDNTVSPSKKSTASENEQVSNDNKHVNNHEGSATRRMTRLTMLNDSRPSTVKSGRTNEVTVRSDSKISLRSETSIGSFDDNLVTIEGPVHESALIRALHNHVETALEKITGEDEEEEGSVPKVEGENIPADTQSDKAQGSASSARSSEILLHNQDSPQTGRPHTMYPITEYEI